MDLRSNLQELACGHVLNAVLRKERAGRMGARRSYHWGADLGAGAYERQTRYNKPRRDFNIKNSYFTL